MRCHREKALDRCHRTRGDHAITRARHCLAFRVQDGYVGQVQVSRRAGQEFRPQSPRFDQSHRRSGQDCNDQPRQAGPGPDIDPRRTFGRKSDQLSGVGQMAIPQIGFGRFGDKVLNLILGDQHSGKSLKAV